MQIYLCPSPDLYSLYHREEAIVIVVDIFRATTTMTTALVNGAVGILPVASTEECQRLGEQYGYLMAAERAVKRCPFAQLGNDPAEYTHERVGGRRIVMTTTNGTRSLTIAREHGARHILIGSLLNLSATLDYCIDLGAREVIVLAAGWQGQASMEDMLYAGALANMAMERGVGEAVGDAAVMMLDLWRATSLSDQERCAYITRSEHYTRLVEAGHQSAVAYCMQIDTCTLAIGLDEAGLWLSPLRAKTRSVHLTPLAQATPVEREDLERYYKDSFPIDEQRPWSQILAPKPIMTPWVIRLTDGTAIGLITLWQLSGILYIEHFCLDRRVRQRGYGAEVLRLLSEQHLTPRETLVLEAEPRSRSAIAKRRITFYERLGLHVLDYPYVQPAYTPSSKPVPLSLLASRELNHEECKAVADLLHREVYNYEPEA